MHFSLCPFYLPLVSGMAPHWTNLNPLHLRMLCAKFSWKWPIGSGEDQNVKSLQTDRQRQLVIRKALLGKLTFKRYIKSSASTKEFWVITCVDNFDRIGTIARIDTVPPISGWILCSLFTSFGRGLKVSITLFPPSWCSDFFQWDTLLRRWSSSIWQQWSLEISNDSTIKNYFNSHMDHLLSGWVLNVQTILQLKATGTSDLMCIIHCQVEGNAKLNFCVLNIHVLLHSFLFPVSIKKN